MELNTVVARGYLLCHFLPTEDRTAPLKSPEKKVQVFPSAISYHCLLGTIGRYIISRETLRRASDQASASESSFTKSLVASISRRERRRPPLFPLRSTERSVIGAVFRARGLATNFRVIRTPLLGHNLLECIPIKMTVRGGYIRLRRRRRFKGVQTSLECFHNC